MSIEKVFDQAALDIITEIRLNLIATGAEATGKTGRSLEDITSDEGMKILGSKSFLFVERGRGPSKKLPPVAPLVEWLEARGIDKAAVWGLRKAIAKRGTLSLRTDGGSTHPRDIYDSVVTKIRIERILSQI